MITLWNSQGHRVTGKISGFPTFMSIEYLVFITLILYEYLVFITHKTSKHLSVITSINSFIISSNPPVTLHLRIWHSAQLTYSGLMSGGPHIAPSTTGRTERGGLVRFAYRGRLTPHFRIAVQWTCRDRDAHAAGQ